jgi:hypothetical protein
LGIKLPIRLPLPAARIIAVTKWLLVVCKKTPSFLDVLLYFIIQNGKMEVFFYFLPHFLSKNRKKVEKKLHFSKLFFQKGIDFLLPMYYNICVEKSGD